MTKERLAVAEPLGHVPSAEVDDLPDLGRRRSEFRPHHHDGCDPRTPALVPEGFAYASGRSAHAHAQTIEPRELVRGLDAPDDQTPVLEARLAEEVLGIEQKHAAPPHHDVIPVAKAGLDVVHDGPVAEAETLQLPGRIALAFGATPYPLDVLGRTVPHPHRHADPDPGEECRTDVPPPGGQRANHNARRDQHAKDRGEELSFP